MSLANLTRTAVEAAIAEFDKLGKEAFLTEYGFSDAKRYWLVQSGKSYPSKAIAGVAHKFTEAGVVLGTNDFTGGEGSVVKKLCELGFTVPAAERNPDWNRDELTLALDLYMKNPASPPGKQSSEVQELSSILNKMHRIMGTASSPSLRNPNGVYMKMMNFRSQDPTFTKAGKKGMNRGNKLEAVLWAEYAENLPKLSADAQSIRDALQNADEGKVAELPQADDYVGEEGGVVMRLHKRYERDRKLVRRKIAEAVANGKLACEICEFDFEAAYGDLGAGYIEVHHTKPVNQLGKGGKTKLSDLALLCANCHRMAHRKRDPLSLAQISEFLKRSN